MSPPIYHKITSNSNEDRDKIQDNKIEKQLYTKYNTNRGKEGGKRKREYKGTIKSHFQYMNC